MTQDNAMNIRFHIAIGLLAVAAPCFAQEDLASLPPIQVTQYMSDCARPSLPTQRQVSEWTGLQNFGQVYDARERLMADIAQACQRPGVGRVQVVLQAEPRKESERRVAMGVRPLR
jgi:hypothetical protein